MIYYTVAPCILYVKYVSLIFKLEDGNKFAGIKIEYGADYNDQKAFINLTSSGFSSLFASLEIARAVDVE